MNELKQLAEIENHLLAARNLIKRLNLPRYKRVKIGEALRQVAFRSVSEAIDYVIELRQSL